MRSRSFVNEIGLNLNVFFRNEGTDFWKVSFQTDDGRLNESGVETVENSSAGIERIDQKVKELLKSEEVRETVDR